MRFVTNLLFPAMLACVADVQRGGKGERRAREARKDAGGSR